MKQEPSLYQEAQDLKDIARISDENLEKYSEAADKYFEASEEITTRSVSEEHQKIKFRALAAYYRFEANECMYGFEYKNGRFSSAQKYAEKAKGQITLALNIIKDNIEKVNDEDREFLEQQNRDWHLPELTIKIRLLEPVAKKAMGEEDYITAFDTYKKMAVVQKEVYDYTLSHIEDLRMHRIESGNYAISEANVAMAYAGILKNKDSAELKQLDLDIDMMRQFQKAYKLSKEAFDANPEWDVYRSGAETVLGNINLLLKNHPTRWHNYLIELDYDIELIKQMKIMDIKKYQELEAKELIKDSKPAELWIYGGFWLLTLVIVVGCIMAIVTMGGTIGWVALMIFAVFALYTIVSATILRSSDKLSEEGYLTLMKLALKLGFENIMKIFRKTED